MKKRILSIVLAICLVLSCVPITVFAANEDATELQNKLNSGGTVTLTKDYTIDTTLKVTNTVTLDLNGHVIKMTGSDRVITFAGGNLTLQDSNKTATHKDSTLPAGGVITGGNQGQGGGVYINNNSTFTMNGGTIANCSAEYGGGVYISSNSTFTMNGGTIANCKATTSDYAVGGGGVYVAQNSNFTMSGGIIENCSAASTVGGGVFSYGNFSMSGNAIIRGCSAKFGGGVHVAQNFNFTMSGGTIENCTSMDGTYDAVGLDFSAFLLANGGIVKGMVFVGSNSAINTTSTDSYTKFYNKVTNHGTISGGVYYGGISGSGTVTGTYHTVSFDSNGGSGSVPTQWFVNTDKTPALQPADPTKDGFVFAGWYNGDTKYDFTQSVTSDMTLTAKWVTTNVSTEAELKEALDAGATSIKLVGDIKLSSTLDLTDKNITLDLNGYVLTGNIQLADSSASPDSILTLIDSNPTATHADSSLPAGGVVKGNITLTRESGSVSHLYANGGTVTGQTSLPSYAGGIFCTSDTPTAFTGYVGNYGEIHGGIFYAGINESCIKENTVTFINGDSRYALEVVASGNKVVAPVSTPLKAGYDFVGWYNGDTKYEFNQTITSDITLTAQWTPAEQFNLTPGGTYWFDLSGETIPGTVNTGNRYGAVSVPDTTLHYVPFTYAGTVDAYKLTSAMVTTEDYAEQNKYPHSLFVADYAVTHTVEWNELNTAGLVFGKSYTGGSVAYTLRAPSMGSWCTGSGDAERGTPQSNEWDAVLDKNSGYIKNWNGIDSWGQDTSRYHSYRANRGYDSARSWDYSGATSQHALVGFRPVLEVLNTDTLGSDGLKAVTLDLNGGKLGGSTDNIQIIVKNGAAFTAPASDGLTAPQVGYSAQWQDSDGNLYAPGDSVPAGVTTLTAQWTPDTYTVTLHLNDGTIANGKDVTEYTYGTGATLPTADDITREGYTFEGWYEDENFSGSPVTEICKTDTGKKEFYAKWTLNTYTVTFDSQGGSKVNSQTVSHGGTVTEPTAPTYECYTFGGWYTEAGCTTEYDFTTTVTESLTLYAKWKDVTCPTGEITVDKSKWNTFFNNITFGLFFKDTQKVTITASDNSGDAVKIEYLLSDKELDETELASETFTAYTEAFSINPDNKYVIYAKLTDHAGNVTYISSEGVVLDASAPVISGVENGKTYCEAQTVTVTEEYIESVKVNGTAVTLDANNQFTLNPAEGTQTIVATDKAGNVSAEITVTVNDGHTYEWQSENGQYWKKCQYCDDETAKKDIPTITINGADAVCVTQDYKFSFTLPEGATDAVYGYELENKGDLGLPAIIENNEPHGVVSMEWFEPGENSFKVYAGAKTADGFEFFVSKTVALKSEHTDAAPKDHICDICGATLSEHTGGEATCVGKAICEYCGEEYGELDSTNHNLENIPAKDATVTATGNKEYWHCKDCGKYFADENGKTEIKFDDTVISKLSPEIIEGKGQSITAGDKKELTFKSNAAFSDFIRVELDGKTLDEKNYTVKEGSTVVTLKADYVATLSAGEHTIGIVSTNGTATTTFTVNAKAVVDNDTKSPQTGDNSHMALWIALLFVSGAGVIGTTVYGKKKRAK